MNQCWIRMGLAPLLAASFVQFFVTRVNADNTAEATYKAKCAACHGPDGSGNTAVGEKLGAHDFRSTEVQKMPDAELNEILAKGKNKMPGYEKSLKPDEIKGLVVYVRSLAPKK